MNVGGESEVGKDGAPRSLVQALATLAPRFSPAARVEKLRVLDALAGARITRATTLARLHESLCFVHAYPDDPEVLARVEDGLRAFPARVRRLSPAERRRLHDTGIAETELDYPFGLPMARWLAGRFPLHTEVAWRNFDSGERLEETLPLLVSQAEGEAFTEAGLGWRKWLALAKGSRRMSDLALLVELFDRAPLPGPARDSLFEGLGLPIRWRLRGTAPSRTRAWLPDAPVHFHRDGLRSRPDLARELARPIAVRPAAPPLARSLIEASRAAMATRGRELYAFSYPNPEDVLLADLDRGLRIALIGLAPDARLPLEAYYAFFALKNGVPIGYGAGWGMFGRLEFAVNVFEAFRQGESAHVIGQVLRVYRQIFRMRVVVIDRTQLGDGLGNVEALRSGAFYFYRRLGFHPLDPASRRLCQHEEARIARDRRYRSPLPVLRRLVRTEMALRLGRAGAGPLTGNAIATLVTDRVARVFGGDRRTAQREDAARVARALGATGWRRWPGPQRRAFARLAPVVALVPDLARWPAAERVALTRVMRAKGAAGEHAYVRRLDAQRRLRAALEALVTGGGNRT